MEVSNKEFEECLYRASVLKTVGRISVSSLTLDIIFNYRDGVFVQFNIYKNGDVIKPTFKQIKTTKQYLYDIEHDN